MSESYTNLMTTFPLLQGFTVAGAEMLMECGEVKRFKAGDVLFKEGDPPSSTLLLLEGALQAYLVRQGGEVLLHTAEPGAILGELAVLCSIPRSACLRAAADSTVLQWEATQFRRLLVRHTLFSERVLGQSLRNLIAKERSIIDSVMGDQI